MAEKEKKAVAGPKKKFNLKQYASPLFLAMLLISFSMWYLTKLSHDYTAEVPVKMNIDGNQFRVTCVAHGSGYRLLSYRVFRKMKLNLGFSEVATTPSVINPGYYVVSPSSLQQVISLANSDLQIISIGDIPEITYNGRL